MNTVECKGKGRGHEESRKRKRVGEKGSLCMEANRAGKRVGIWKGIGR